MKKLLLTIICAGLFTNMLLAQNVHFTTSGVVEYNKTINMYALIRKGINKDNESFYQPMYEEYQKDHPQFATQKSTLAFSGNKTLFSPVVDPDQPTGNWFDTPAADQNNIIFTDLTAGKSITQKQVFEQTYLVKDSTRQIKWKITDETRDIAGFHCRRANAIVQDSVYVVAFYTDQVHVSGGPESFTGLPGLILEVALPHENITWLATKVTDNAVADKDLTPPKKGKPVDNKTLKTTLQSVMKNWGSDAQLYLKALLL